MNTNTQVVVIEDDAMLSTIIMQHLAEEHISAKLFTTGENAFELLKQDVPKVLVLDIFLPRMNGLEILEALRKDAATKDIRVLIVSNNDLLKDRERAKAMGADFLIKAAIMPMDIITRVKKLLALTRV